MPFPLQVNKAVVSLISITPKQFVALFAGAYLTYYVIVLVFKVYIFK
jgi:hypothetical protein